VVKFQDDPTGFLVAETYGRMQRCAELYGEVFQNDVVVWPETVSLNGLRVFCQQRQ
jgi:hypothetical protein